MEVYTPVEFNSTYLGVVYRNGYSLLYKVQKVLEETSML